MQTLTEKVIQLWNQWQIQVLVLLSLSLQIILVMFGSRRKYIARSWGRILVWTAYSSADQVAIFTLGILARSQGDTGNGSVKLNNLIEAFWAPFLLLHLGGPDTITAYSLEDKEQWLRNLLGLGVQVGAFYVFLKSWNSTSLTYLAIPILTAGMIKYGERTWVLKSSGTKHIEDSSKLVPSPPDSQDNEEFPWGVRHFTPVASCLGRAYYLFKISTFLFEDRILGYKELTDSHRIMSHVVSAEDVFKLVEVELGFMYDVLYTKALLVYSKLGIFLRFITFSSSIATLVGFSIIVDKHSYTVANIAVTYTLLVGALVLEVYSFIDIIFSDWAMKWWAKFENIPAYTIGAAISSLRLSHDKRWSRSMGQCNLISYCLKGESLLAQCAELFGVDEMMNYLHINWEDLNAELKDLIFRQLEEKGNEIICNNGNLRYKLVAQRGDGVFERRRLSNSGWCTIEEEFNHSLLMWHIATDICYYGDIDNLNSKCKISKCLSDYMLYLLILRPSMLPKGIGDKKSAFELACKEVKKYFQNKGIKTLHSQMESGFGLLEADPWLVEFETNRKVYHDDQKAPIVLRADGDRQCFLARGCKLAQQLQSLEFEKWATISEVWIEMLAYAASHCEWKEHAQQLRRGGELLTHVFLLMTHLGISLTVSAHPL